MRADILSSRILYIWLLACAISIMPLVFLFFSEEELVKPDIRNLIGTAISLIIPTTGLAFSRLLVDHSPSKRQISKHLIPVIIIGVISAPLAIFITGLIYAIDLVPPNSNPFSDAALIIPISTAAMFYVFGVAMNENG